MGGRGGGSKFGISTPRLLWTANILKITAVQELQKLLLPFWKGITLKTYSVADFNAFLNSSKLEESKQWKYTKIGLPVNFQYKTQNIRIYEPIICGKCHLNC